MKNLKHYENFLNESGAPVVDNQKEDLSLIKKTVELIKSKKFEEATKMMLTPKELDSVGKSILELPVFSEYRDWISKNGEAIAKKEDQKKIEAAKADAKNSKSGEKVSEGANQSGDDGRPMKQHYYGSGYATIPATTRKAKPGETPSYWNQLTPNDDIYRSMFGHDLDYLKGPEEAGFPSFAECEARRKKEAGENEEWLKNGGAQVLSNVMTASIAAAAEGNKCSWCGANWGMYDNSKHVKSEYYLTKGNWYCNKEHESKDWNWINDRRK